VEQSGVDESGTEGNNVLVIFRRLLAECPKIPVCKIEALQKILDFQR